MQRLSERELSRYQSQIRMQEIGLNGQKKLKKARVAIVGVGGLGSAAGYYLAAAGIGHLTIIDIDHVEISNLNRQILYKESDLGKSKVDCAIRKLRKENSDIEIKGVHAPITEENVFDLLGDIDAVLDGLDNFTGRFLLNRLAVQKRIPFFHGACLGFQGRMTTILPGESPCLKCIIPGNPPERKSPVVGSTPGIIGSIQATEVIKYFLGLFPLLSGKLFMYDGLNLVYEIITTEKNPQCNVCGEIKG